MRCETLSHTAVLIPADEFAVAAKPPEEAKKLCHPFQIVKKLVKGLSLYPCIVAIVCLIDDWLVLDVSGSVSIFQGRKRLLKIGVCRRDAGDHQSSAVTTERVLEETRDLRVPIGHMSASPQRVPEGANDVAQR